MNGKLIVFSAPSGSGKSTIINWLMQHHPELNLVFSVSATSRPPRGQERDGVEYYFLSPDEFRRRIAAGDFLEAVEVYPNRFYGTLRSEVDKRLQAGQNVVLDIDVDGAARIKQLYGEQALTVFVQPPSVQALRSRLEGRGTDTPQVIEDRIARAEYELSFAPRYDIVVVNDVLDSALCRAYEALKGSLLATPNT